MESKRVFTWKELNDIVEKLEDMSSWEIHNEKEDLRNYYAGLAVQALISLINENVELSERVVQLERDNDGFTSIIMRMHGENIDLYRELMMQLYGIRI